LTHDLSLSDSDIRRIVARYPIGSWVVEPLAPGLVNPSYLIRASSGHYVLTVLADHDEPAARRLVALLEYLSEQGVRTSRPVRTRNGEQVVLHAGRPVVVKSFLPGTCGPRLPVCEIENSTVARGTNGLPCVRSPHRQSRENHTLDGVIPSRSPSTARASRWVVR
jgi:hypothetical protein